MSIKQSLRPSIALGFGVLLLSGAGCATAGGSARGSDAVSRLEAARDADPRSVAALRALGIAYYKANRFEDSRKVLAHAHGLAPKDGLVALYLGLSAEQLGDLPAARAAYSTYLEHGRTSRARAQLRSHLVLLTRKELEVAARTSLAQEATIAQTPGDPSTIAVLPLTFSGQDSSLRPLERGLADLLITDLSRSALLTVVERDRMQTLLTEIALSQGPGVDAGTALRGGRLVRAGRIVQGSITELPSQTLAVDAAVVDVPTTQALTSVQHTDRLEQLFVIEKRIAFGIFDALGVRLSAAERALVEQRPTRSLAAFLSYSAGLLAEDNGNLDEAARHYAEALRLDPNFSAAAKRQEDVRILINAGTYAITTIEPQLRGTQEGAIVSLGERGFVSEVSSGGSSPLGFTLIDATNDLNPSPAADAATITTTAPANKDPASSTGSTENPAGNTGRITVIIRQP